MPDAVFLEHFPEIAERETRTITLLQRSPSGLAPGDYSLLEMFCDEAGCDCRRVMFCVVSSHTKDVEAVVAYGWESRDFYAKWMHDDDPDVIDELQGPILNLASPNSQLMLPNVIQDSRLVVTTAVENYRIQGGSSGSNVTVSGATLGSGTITAIPDINDRLSLMSPEGIYELTTAGQIC